MKNNFLKIVGFALISVILVGMNSCVKDDLDAPPAHIYPIGEEITIADLWATATSVPVKIVEEKSIFGVVTMGEAGGNLYKETFIRDHTGGLKLEFWESAGFNVGDSVQVQLQGTRLYNDNDVIMLDSVDVVYNVRRISAGANVDPVEITIADLNTGSYVCQLVKLKGVQFTDAELGETWADAVALQTINRDLEDCNGGKTIVRSSGYANFASTLLPVGNGDLIAIASSYRGTSQMLIRNPQENNLTGTRCDGSGGGGGGSQVDPVDAVNEHFDAAVDYTDISISGWNNIIVEGDRAWQGKIFNSDKYAQASGYNSGLAAMETWLITPPVKDISTKVLSFRSAMAYWAHVNNEPMTVYISTDYIGDNFETATWTELSVTMASSSSSDNAWIESGEVDLSAYSGNAAIAFKYVGSDAETTSFRLDDIMIDVSGGGGGGGGGSIDPVDEINETFDAAVNYTDIDFEGWTNVVTQGDRKWQGKEFNTDRYTQASGYNSGLAAMETWLITPPITNIGTKTLSLKTAMAFWAHSGSDPLTVLVSEDFNGDNFETASWAELSVPMANSSSADNAWIESGDVSLSAFSGTAAIAFKYVGSDTESTSFRLDDIKVTADGGGGGGGGGSTVDMIDEQFDSSVNYEDVNLAGWVNVNVEGDRMWQGKVYESDKYAQSTGYNSGLSSMECWLITPVISDIASKSLSLKTAMAFWAHAGEALTIMVSTDYDGENYATATWTAIDVTTASSSDTDHEWIDSGSVSLSAFSGDAAIAFKYVGSDTESTSIRLDDIKVQ